MNASNCCVTTLRESIRTIGRIDVTNGAQPLFGPAARPLPQLPIEVDDEGYLRARGDFSAPVGPGFWNGGSGP